MEVGIVGAGVSGMAMALRLQRAGIAFTVFEKGDEVGGTWRDNRYPGLTIDVPSVIYTFAGERNPHWRRWMPAQQEILDYHRDVSMRTGIREHIRFGCEVTAATWLGDRWELVAGGERHEFRAVVFASGFLHHPNTPPIPGLETFAGELVHSARWRDDIVTDGRRVGVIGTGSTGVQLVSALAGHAAHVTLFQRTAQWIMPLPNFTIPPAVRRLLARRPQLIERTVRGVDAVADWLLGGASIRPGMRRNLITLLARAHLGVVRDPELRAKLTPPDTVLCKRPVVSTRFYRAVQRPDVAVVTEPIERVCPEGVVAGGVVHELDVLILATGFRAHAYMRPVAITGEDGLTLDAAWAAGPHGYRTVALPGFPNLFMLMGPHSPLLSFPIHTSAELQSEFVAQLLALLDDAVSVQPTAAATERWLAFIRAGMPDTVWASGCTSWYLGAGDTPVLWPYDGRRWREILRTVDRADFEIRTPVPAAA